MDEKDEKFPDPKKVEKEISDFLSEKFGGRVKLITPMVVPREESFETEEEPPKKKKIDFSLKPEELEAYLDQYLVKQDEAKAILATKICTHFNRINYAQSSDRNVQPILGNIKNNVLMIGPTGVGKTYVIKLIAQKIGVPFVKGDATKFSETGYVGGDVEDLVRDLVREADDDIELAQYGIIYIDEIDKIGASNHLIGPDVSRTGVQRALLKPMEETEVDLKVPHDPISMLEEVERYRKTGKRKKRVINTKHILFIMSGAFNELAEIIRNRVADQGIGFGASVKSRLEAVDYLQYTKPEDLIKFGFETEFIGRLPVISLFEKLGEEDLFAILKNPNNPVILSKKLDFNAYGIDVKFDTQALRAMARGACKEGTGARGLVSVIEKALLKFEKRLPSTGVKKLSVTEEVVNNPDKVLQEIVSGSNGAKWDGLHEKLAEEEKESIAEYVKEHQRPLADRYHMALTPSRIRLIADIYALSTCDVNTVMETISDCRNKIKNMEAYFRKTHDLHVTLDEDAKDVVMLEMSVSEGALGDFYKRLTSDFEDGFKLIRDRTGRKDFVISKEGLEDPKGFLAAMVKSIYPDDSGHPTEVESK
ncbi:MAG: AAA family ATPase [Thermodesulfobacteriota bacterium]|nr:AAA family ATPase [Thermodesulfobacteriota bacterium]